MGCSHRQKMKYFHVKSMLQGRLFIGNAFKSEFVSYFMARLTCPVWLVSSVIAFYTFGELC